MWTFIGKNLQRGGMLGLPKNLYQPHRGTDKKNSKRNIDHRYQNKVDHFVHHRLLFKQKVEP
jgi:hypothetical protein